ANIQMREIENAMENISPDFSVPFMLHYHGYKYDEIAQSMKLPLGTVKSRIFFARKALQKKVSRH
ncbi:MAG TPA: sigma factor-like helix-turn-helix DNA-binding protein, partial [Chitinophagales bacterium]|nr:sigma factor-like helix-turn-helix DNA-binding protein [Chitinophagales bacterium]